MSTRIFQKCAGIGYKLSVAASVVFAILLLLTDATTDEAHRASYGACAFFFGAMAVVLHAISSSNLPSFKPKD